MKSEQVLKKRIRGFNIKAPADAKRLLQNRINGVIKGKVTPEELRAIAYATSIVLKTFEVGEFADRLEKLEKKLLKKGR